MCPIYAVLAAPLARPLGVPVMLWFTHWRASRLLRLAERVSTAVATVERRSFPLASRESARDRPRHRPGRLPLRRARRSATGIELLSLAPRRRLRRDSRRSSARVALGAGGAARPPRAVADRGGAPSPGRARVASSPRSASADARRDRRPGAPWRRPRPARARPTRSSTTCRPVRTDKAVYEAAAACLPVLASNPALDGFLPDELRFERDDPDGLAARIRPLATADWSPLGRELRARVEREHSVEGWADRIVELAAEGKSTVCKAGDDRSACREGIGHLRLGASPAAAAAAAARARLGRPLRAPARGRGGSARARRAGWLRPACRSTRSGCRFAADPRAFARLARLSGRQRPSDPAHAPRPRRLPRPRRPAGSPACRYSSRPSTASTRSAPRALRTC